MILMITITILLLLLLLLLLIFLLEQGQLLPDDLLLVVPPLVHPPVDGDRDGDAEHDDGGKPISYYSILHYCSRVE